MADHAELVAEIPLVEKMPTQERLKHAKKRRTQQLKKWQQREKEWAKKEKKLQKSVSKTVPNTLKIHFVPNVMLLEAAARNDIDEVRRLLMIGVSPDVTNEDGLTALHQCCIDDCQEMMELLLEFGANVNAKDSEFWTPLHAAATCGHLHLVKLLISKGADLLAVNADGNMPYDICEDEQTLDHIESIMASRGVTQELIDSTRSAPENQMLQDLLHLVEAGGNLELAGKQGETPLHIAAANGYTKVVEYLLDHHVGVDGTDDDQWQPIHAAACWGHPQILELLVQSGADLEAKTKNGESPYDICEDLDLRDRIVEMKNEIEVKKASKPSNLRRTHSQNTRSQSIRRTSIREKSMMSRREAQQEARFRQSQEGLLLPDEDKKPAELSTSNVHVEVNGVGSMEYIDCGEGGGTEHYEAISGGASSTVAASGEPTYQTISEQTDMGSKQVDMNNVCSDEEICLDEEMMEKVQSMRRDLPALNGDNSRRKCKQLSVSSASESSSLASKSGASGKNKSNVTKANGGVLTPLPHNGKTELDGKDGGKPSSPLKNDEEVKHKFKSSVVVGGNPRKHNRCCVIA